MAKAVDNPSAFPCIEAIDAEPWTHPGGSSRHEVTTTGGMSLRDWFAGQALTGLVATGSRLNERGAYDSGTRQQLAWQAYEFADAMLAEREK